MKKYNVKLSFEERVWLEDMVKTGKCVAYKRTRAHILLLADESGERKAMTDVEIAKVTIVSVVTVEQTRKRLVLLGLEQALERKKEKLRQRTSV